MTSITFHRAALITAGPGASLAASRVSLSGAHFSVLCFQLRRDTEKRETSNTHTPPSLLIGLIDDASIPLRSGRNRLRFGVIRRRVSGDFPPVGRAAAAAAAAAPASRVMLLS